MGNKLTINIIVIIIKYNNVNNSTWLATVQTKLPHLHRLF